MQLKEYIQGNKHGKEANRLEREAMNDPFLQEALEGFDAVTGEHVNIIDQLEQKYSGVTVETRHATSLPHRTRLFYWSAAASILLLIGFGTFFFMERNIIFDQPAIVLHEVQESEREAAFDFPLLAQNKESQQEMSDIARTSQKAISAPTPPSSITIAQENSSLGKTMIVADTDYLSDQPEELLAMESSKEQKIMVQDEKQGKSTIQGKVVDENGDPLIGVSIVEKGTKNGTVTDINGNFSFLPSGDSSKLIANYLGYEPQEILASNTAQTVTLRPSSHLALLDEVVVGYGMQKKSSMSGAVSTIQSSFGEKEFQTWCQQKAGKNVCGDKNVSVKVSFFIDETGKPSQIEFQKYSCEEAKKEMENLLSASPVWTKTNRKVNVIVKW